MSYAYAAYHRKSSRDEGRQRLSIEMQHADIARMMPHWGNLNIRMSLDEMRTATKPGRPSFNEIMDAIDKGDVQGLIAWHPDRLSRNAVDAGRIMYLLSVGKLKDLKFVSYTFENTAEGRLMLSIMLSQATYYSDALSKRINLSIQTKLSHGWRPNMAPLGYLNDRNTHTIVRDPDRFGLVEELWRRMLTGNYSVRSLFELASKKWGLRTRKHEKRGNRPVALSGIYRILTSPFYAGILTHHGKVFPGKHERMVSLDEFNRVQAMLGRPHARKKEPKEYPFTGAIVCGECGFSITAEDKRKGRSVYTYYHCTKRRTDYRCRQRYLSSKDLESQIAAFVDRAVLSRAFQEWALERIAQFAGQREESTRQQLTSVDAGVALIDRELKNLLEMRLRDLITDEEYLARRNEKEQARLALHQRRELIEGAEHWFEPARLLISFSNRAADLIRHAEPHRKRLVLRILGSNPTLIDRKFNCEARKPFRLLAETSGISTLRATWNEVRTLHDSGDPDFLTLMEQIKEVLQEPETASDKAA